MVEKRVAPPIDVGVCVCVVCVCLWDSTHQKFSIRTPVCTHTHVVRGQGSGVRGVVCSTCIIDSTYMYMSCMEEDVPVGRRT